MKNKNIEGLGNFFPLKDMETWIRTSYKKYYSSKVRAEIHAELVDPLFMKAGVNIKDEDDIPKHRKDNLVCCYEYFLRELKRIKKKGSRDELFLATGCDFFPVLEEFRSCYKKIISAANKKGRVDFPFSWMFNYWPRSNVRFWEIDDLIKKTEKEKIKAEEDFNNYYDDLQNDEEAANKHSEELWRTLSEVSEKLYQIKLEKFAGKFKAEMNIDLAIQQIKHQMKWIKVARGKRGRRLDPFNVLVYHIIKKCTRFKLDKDHEPVCRKGFYKLEKCGNGQPRLVRSDRGEKQYRLEKNWKLILFLVLDIHIHMKELQKIKEFISQHRNRPADEALRNLKQKLLDIYKNFPPLDGFPFEYRIDETGFRKLIVTDDGRLKIVRL